LSIVQLQEVKNGDAEAATRFCVDIINETQEFAAAFKPNAAFFEQLGADGIVALEHVMKAIPADIPVILDFKRGDIESTAEV
jgi:orotidine-5'-phosphate decarboxylase